LLIRKEIFFTVIGLFVTVLIFSCNAPRNNPFDPYNSDNELVELDGYVRSMSLPRIPLAGTTLIFENSKLIVTTDNDGYFRFDNVHVNNGWLKIQKNGYLKDSIYISWESKKNKTVEIFLNELPLLENYTISSIVINRYIINPITYLVINAKISDKDNDVDSVFIFNPELGLKKSMDYNVNKKSYETTLYPFEMNISDIEMIVGYSFKILVKDINQNIIEVGSDEVKRIIKSEVIFESPKDLEIVSSLPTLKWRRFLPGFSFSYLVEIYTNETNAQLLWRKENISSDDITVNVDSPLQAGNYFWVVWCMDSFNNKSRSKPASFVVE
jgi:hypothetical protein